MSAAPVPCSHVWRDWSAHSGGRAVVWCSKCDALAFAGQEEAAPVNRDTAAYAASLARDNERLREALLALARSVEALKRPCGMDPESPQAIRNGTYMSIALNARAALSAAKEQQP